MVFAAPAARTLVEIFVVVVLLLLVAAFIFIFIVSPCIIKVPRPPLLRVDRAEDALEEGIDDNIPNAVLIFSFPKEEGRDASDDVTASKSSPK